jgi:hypothetical protein
MEPGVTRNVYPGRRRRHKSEHSKDRADKQRRFTKNFRDPAGSSTYLFFLWRLHGKFFLCFMLRRSSRDQSV